MFLRGVHGTRTLMPEKVKEMIATPPVDISPSNEAIYHLRTKQIHLYRTCHAGAMRYPISDTYIVLLLGDIAEGDIASV